MADQDVSAADPSAAEPNAEGSVNAQPGTDRPLQNIVGEFNRKYARLEQQLQNVLTFLGNQQQQAEPVTEPAATGEETDEELWARASRGDRKAFELYQERIADRRIAQRTRQDRFEGLIDRQLNAIVERYPVLRDPNHALAQHANAVYSALLGQGYPQGKATLLEAAKTAITDRPDLVIQLNTSTTTRRAAATGQTGASHRSTPVDTGEHKVKEPGEAELAVARRMGVKDPKGAKERFLKRYNEGTSKVGSVGQMLDSEEL